MKQSIQLKLLSINDAETLAMHLNDSLIYKTTASLPYPYTLQHAQAFIDYSQNLETGRNFGIFKENNELIGGIGYQIKALNNSAEVGYWIASTFWGKGYATMALSMLLEQLFNQEHLHKVYAYHFVDNVSSGKVMIKNGMKFDGILRSHVYKEGKYLDVCVYSILEDEYLCLKK